MDWADPFIFLAPIVTFFKVLYRIHTEKLGRMFRILISQYKDAL